MRLGTLANCSTIAKEYEVCPKSIQRDIEYLKDHRDAPIEYDRKRHGYYYTEENYALPGLEMKESELFAICVAQKVLAQHRNTPVYGHLVKVFEKIEEALPEKVSVHPFWVDSRFSAILDAHTSIDPSVWAVIADGLQGGCRIRIHYCKPGGDSAKSREVDPYHVVSYQGEWYLVGYCHLREKILTFAVSRIEKARVLSAHFQMPEDFDFTESAQKRFGIFEGEGEYAVKVQFDKVHAPFIRERIWHPSQRIAENSDGSIVFTMTTRHLLEVKRWILSWGKGAKVLAPKELIREVREELDGAAKEYQR